MKGSRRHRREPRAFNELRNVPRDPTAQEVHQAQILANYQTAVRLRDESFTVLGNAQVNAERAERDFDIARRAMRRVSEGSV